MSSKNSFFPNAEEPACVLNSDVQSSIQMRLLVQIIASVKEHNNPYE